jgi:tetratricopeptide (TPR) repeat protein
MRERGIRQWWLAEQLRVDRKTISRWMSGKVRRISAENLTNLAGILGCSEADLVAGDPTDVFASAEDQARAARLIDERSLIETLAPAGQWDLMEALIRAVMRPELPVYMLGQLYNNLAISAWRRGKLDEAQQHADAAMELGERSGNKAVIANAWLNCGTVAALRGAFTESQDHYQRALALLTYLDNTLDRGKVLSNIGTNHLDLGEYEQCIIYQQRAVDEFTSMDPVPDMNISIALTNMARAQRALGDNTARATAARSLAHAQAGKYLDGIKTAGDLLQELETPP